MILDIRLRTAADMVPRGARLADIGSDHAYHPIALCLENKIDCALASDINEGPVSAAVANIHKNGLSDKIVAVRADGLDKTKGFSPDCITIRSAPSSSTSPLSKIIAASALQTNKSIISTTSEIFFIISPIFILCGGCKG